MADYMTDFRNRQKMRRAIRDQAAIADYNANADRARNDRGLRLARSRYIDSIPSISPQYRQSLHHRQSSRREALYVPDEHRQRLLDYDRAIESGASSLDDFYLKQNAVTRDNTATNYMPRMLTSQLRQGNAKAAADNALAAQRTADATDTIATMPARIREREAKATLDELGAVGTAAGELVPPGFDETSRPAPMNDLDRSRQKNLDASTAKIINEITTKPKSEATRQRAQVLERLLARDSDATDSEKQWARQELAAMAAQLADDGEIDTVRRAQDQYGEMVYEIAPGQWVYKDGSPYVDPEQKMKETLDAMKVE